MQQLFWHTFSLEQQGLCVRFKKKMYSAVCGTDLRQNLQKFSISSMEDKKATCPLGSLLSLCSLWSSS